MAVRRLLADGKPDLILSGVNSGQNVADDVTYSGTIAGAIEGTLLGVPSIALSQAYPHGERARMSLRRPRRRTGPDIIRKLIAFGFPEGVLYNVNFPNRAPDEIEGITVTSQGKLAHGLHIDERFDGRGNQYFWLAYRRGEHTITPGHRHPRDRRGRHLGDAASPRPDRLRSRRPASPPFRARRLGGSRWRGTDVEESRERIANLILRLRRAGITDQRVLAAIESVPRDLFVPPERRADAYAERALPIDCGQTISRAGHRRPDDRGARSGDRDRVLEIGTGTGYQTAVLARLCRRVYTIERFRTLVAAAESRFKTLRLTNVTTLVGDGIKGWPEQAPFDKIIVTAAGTEVPEALLAAGARRRHHRRARSARRTACRS